ncbi:Lipase family protein [Coccidioides posadasii C735 delta SOWgp]|uniref:sn-1-specific diacylglycerol lipase n=1 Tax=Coccidioides posadasii (strain C735) TaxID=222929 RepID=C5NZI8_COCP7|nr:Lipase family protein [Coccidioides posadasii C735 delta SOWgp]EER29881.1 Lipase family protein [Coccidioides posadasii C735 delta SOWgp]|eukprot:XP_003072026.1 Lipase family protein [Coccidioides posadasii C735 delta SOWgp]
MPYVYKNHVNQRQTREVVRRADGDVQKSAGTLLPRPVASLVTLFAHSTSLSLRVGTFLGGFAIDSFRATTLTGLELSRAVVESILIRAGRDVLSRSSDDYGRAEAESLLERSLATLHSTITSASFFASASFHLSATTLSSVSHFSQSLLSTLDAILGSSESSRAIAAIITLIRREFRNPETGVHAGKVGVGDLLVGCIGFAMLQRWGRRNTEREFRENGNEEIIWDVVILDNGLRADVVGTQRTEYPPNVESLDTPPTRPASFLAPEETDADMTFQAMERESTPLNPLGRLVPHVSLPADRQHALSDEEIRHYIVNQLPRGSHATIKTDSVIARTITVDVYDSQHKYIEISPPPGTALVKESFHEDHDAEGVSAYSETQLPKHTVVFQTVSNQSQTAELRPETQHPVEEEIAGGHSPRLSSHRRSPKRPKVSSWVSDPVPTVEFTPVNAKIRQARSRRPSFKRTISESSFSGSETPRASSQKRSVARTTHKLISNAEAKLGSMRSTKKRPAFSSPSSRQPSDFNKENAAAGPKGLLRSGRSKQPAQPAAQRPKLLPALPLTSGKHDALKSRRSDEHAVDSLPDTVPTRDYFPSHEKCVESYLARTDAYSLHAYPGSPSLPAVARNHISSTSSLSRVKSDSDMQKSSNENLHSYSPIASRRNSSKSLAPTIYSLAEADSKASLVLAPRFVKSVYEDQDTLSALSRDGKFFGLFPYNHLVRNIQRFSRFSSASYGSHFLRVMGISTGPQDWQNGEVDHHEHSSFSNHTGMPPSTILLSSFVDPAGGSNASGQTQEGFPLVHYLTLDHDSKAVVLTLRGTWGFEDILTDMTCDYDDLHWMGKTWQVHKGMLASAKRLLEGGGARVMATIKAALEEFTDYGVVFCGHSLGGGVAALLAILISRPNDTDMCGPSFVTASTHSSGTEGNIQRQPGQFRLPAGRPIHVYAYGPPAVMSSSLRLATRRLITTTVNGQDVVPSLSLGVLHDFHAVSLSFKSDVADAKSYVKSRVWDSISRSIANKFYIHQPPLLIHAGNGVGEDSWAWNTLKSLRSQLTAAKLMPPGEVFVVDTMRVLQRDAFTLDTSSGDGYPRLGRPATRVQLRFIRDVEARFGEIRFGSGMLGDHSPGRYEASLAALARGVLDN